MPHVADGILHAYIDGALDALRDAGELPDDMTADDVIAHLSMCADCSARLETERAIRERAGLVLRDIALPQAAPPPFAVVERTRRQRTRRAVPLAWAASLLLALGAGWWGSALWRTGGAPPTGPVQEAATRSERSTADAAAPSSVSNAPEPSMQQEAVADAAARGPEEGSSSAQRRVGAAAATDDGSARPAPPPPVAEAGADERRAPLGGAARLDTLRGAPAPPVLARSREPQAGADVQSQAARAFMDLAATGAVRFITPGPELLAFERLLIREQSDGLLWRAASAGDSTVARQLFVIRDASDPEIEVAREISQTALRSTQTLPTGERVELVTWQRHEIGLEQFAGTGSERAQAPTAAAPLANRRETVAPSFMVSAAEPRRLSDGRTELVLYEESSDIWLALRANLEPQQLRELTATLIRPRSASR